VAYRTWVWCGNLRGRVQLEDVLVDRKIILKLFLKDRLGGRGLGSSGSEQGQRACSCEHGNELPVSITYGKFRG
jgi:hypothetical protein